LPIPRPKFVQTFELVSPQNRQNLNTLRLEIVTPEATVYSEEVEMVLCRGWRARWGSCLSTCA
jgi:hypothetical protein